MARGGAKRVTAERRIGACADYLLGVKVCVIELKWNVSHASITRWIRRTGSFKLRKPEDEQ